MKCNKWSKRSIFNLFKVYTCNNCELKQDDEFFIIGKQIINIYYINRCGLNKVNDDLIFFSHKLIILLRDFIINQGEYIYIWMDKEFPLELLDDDIEILFDLGNNIHLIWW